VPDVNFAFSVPGEFPYEGPFDVITAFDVFEHIPLLDATLDWISCNLRPGGGLVFVVPVYDGPTGPLIRFLDRDPSHVHRRSRDFWLVLASGKFGLLDWYGIYRYLVPGGIYLHVVTRRLRRFTPAIACVMQRRQE
jgi:SAM-dependent methyltransferase